MIGSITLAVSNDLLLYERLKRLLWLWPIMGEIAALSTAFDKEFKKACDTLPTLSILEHDAYLNKYRCAVKLMHRRRA